MQERHHSSNKTRLIDLKSLHFWRNIKNISCRGRGRIVFWDNEEQIGTCPRCCRECMPPFDPHTSHHGQGQRAVGQGRPGTSGCWAASGTFFFLEHNWRQSSKTPHFKLFTVWVPVLMSIISLLFHCHFFIIPYHYPCLSLFLSQQNIKCYKNRLDSQK